MASASSSSSCFGTIPVTKMPTISFKGRVCLSFSGNVSSLKIPKLAMKKTGSRGGSLGTTMKESASGSYAKALADLAVSTGTLETVAEDVEKIDKIFSEKEVFDFFINPTIVVENKRKVIEEISTTSKLQPHTTNFLNVLIDMKRIDLIIDIVKEFEYVYNNLTDTEPAVITSVVKLESQHLAQIAKGVQKLTGAKNVRIKTVIDPSLVAGFTIRYGNSGSKMVDFSVKKQLEDIASQLNIGDVQLAKKGTIIEITDMMDGTRPQIAHIFSQSNSAADLLAKFGSRGNFITSVSLEDFPPKFRATKLVKF